MLVLCISQTNYEARIKALQPFYFRNVMFRSASGYLLRKGSDCVNIVLLTNNLCNMILKVDLCIEFFKTIVIM